MSDAHAPVNWILLGHALPQHRQVKIMGALSLMSKHDYSAWLVTMMVILRAGVVQIFVGKRSGLLVISCLSSGGFDMSLRSLSCWSVRTFVLKRTCRLMTLSGDWMLLSRRLQLHSKGQCTSRSK